MVSKLKSVFNTFLGPERPNVSTTTRKRSLDEEVSEDEEDDYVTPNLKRPKLHMSPKDAPPIINGIENGTEQSPLVRVAEWVKQKALSFSESYFYSKRGEKRITNTVPRNRKRNFEEMYICKPKHNGSRRHQTPTKLFVGANRKIRMSEVIVEDEQSDSEQSLSDENPNQKEVLSRVSGGGGDADSRSCQTYNAVQPQSDLADLPTASDLPHHQIDATDSKYTFQKPIHVPSHLANSSKQIKTQISSRQSNFEPTAVRLTTSYSNIFPKSSQFRNRLQNHKVSYTVKESIRLQHRDEYQQLLQQFTTADVNFFRPASPPVEVNQTQEETIHNDDKEVPRVPKVNSTFSIHAVQTRKEVRGERILTHNYTSHREIREAARQRLHAPTSELSVCVTPPNERNSIATPTQPDFDRSESPIITGVHMPSKGWTSTSSRELSSFQQNLSKSVVAKEDWIKDLKLKFESSTRERIRRAEEERIKTKIYEERRMQEMCKIEQTIRKRMLIAESEPPVLPEVAEPEISEDELDETEDLPMLTDEMEDVIDAAFAPDPPNETLVQGFKCTLTRSNIQTLNGLNWLNDEVINFYMSLLVERSENDNYPKAHNFNTFFYPKLLQGGHKPIRRWTKKVDIFSKHLILVPVHLGMHWCLAIIDMRKKTISYYDSMGNGNPKCLQALKQYLYDEHVDKKQSELDMTGWKLITCSNLPQQMNGSDCGMFACKYAEYICRDAPITFTQEDMPYFRRRMVWEIINKQLL
ncbi:uncharacterized protein [Antedon mediterranea]|uniref:uncharacterized protein isoform X2 n=1 Tax=Antedon mediterranea TaxID=105859 RepID=UPI003AF9E522